MSVSANPDYGIVTASVGGGVMLQDKTINHVGGSATRTAGIAILANGTTTWPRTFTNVQLNPLTDWIIPNGAASASYDVRLTNLTWILKDEGFAVSPSGGTYTQPMPAGPYAADSDGDEDIWWDLGTDRYWVFIDDDSSADPVGTQHATFDIEIRNPGGTTVASAAMDWKVSSSGGGGGGGCFILGTQFRMADGSLKEVQEIEPGDVMEEGGEVYQSVIGNGNLEDWYDVDGVVVTGTHAMNKDGKWVRIREAGYPQTSGGDKYYAVINENHRMIAANGQLFTDYEELDYMTVEFGDWIMHSLNGEDAEQPLKSDKLSLRP
jgi:hypothetical protein